MTHNFVHFYFRITKIRTAIDSHNLWFLFSQENKELLPPFQTRELLSFGNSVGLATFSHATHSTHSDRTGMVKLWFATEVLQDRQAEEVTLAYDSWFQ